MDQTLQALGGIVLSALPTLFIVLLLYVYLKFMFFRPLERVLHQRSEATEGARKAAETSLTRAAEKAAEYEKAIRDARSEIYKNQEQLRRKLRDDQAAAIRTAREDAAKLVDEARASLAADAAQARQGLAAEVEALAEQITQQILRRGVAA
ncbi:MAG: ATP synthase F0 subunit B [Bryobacteraceae bacterium]|nr:ATP synthase F0 subunit B [Bryobacteraceae bacterium]